MCPQPRSATRMGPRHRVMPAGGWMVAFILVALAAGACGGGGGSGTGGDDALDAPSVIGERVVQVVGAGRVRLSGTLTVPPPASGGTVPGVLIVPSAGPGDRNGVTGPAGRSEGLAQDLARALSDAGLVSYRYDRRGTGESRLDPETRLSFDDQVADARAGLDLLAQRRETAGRDLGVVAYGQGGLIGLRLAATDDRVKRLVLISVPGGSVVDAQAAELAAQYGGESADALRSTVAGLMTSRSLPPIDTMRAELRPLLPPQEAAFLAELYGIDPTVDARRIRVATLVVVPKDPAPYDPARLAAALGSAEVVTATSAGPTLMITGPPPANDPSDPSSPSHEHGAPTPVAETRRDDATIARVTGFLTATAPARRP